MERLGSRQRPCIYAWIENSLLWNQLLGWLVLGAHDYLIILNGLGLLMALLGVLLCFQDHAWRVIRLFRSSSKHERCWCWLFFGLLCRLENFWTSGLTIFGEEDLTFLSVILVLICCLNV